MRKLRKGTISTIILILVFLAGLCLLLYPTVSDYWNKLHQTRAIATYTEQVADLSNADYTAILEEAQAYNARLAETGVRWKMTDGEVEEYEQMLSLPNTSVIGYIEIAKIDCYLPIYHGTDPAVLQVGIGHLEGTSLPVGGEGTHTVLSGHRGLTSARLFTDLDQMEIGDTFVLYVLDETLTYEVDQILIVEPDDLSALKIVEGEDYCTLVTCTPYGINTHRLLVRGHRTENAASSTVRVTADAMQIEPLTVVPLVAAPVLLLLFILLMVRTGKRRRDRRKEAAGTEQRRGQHRSRRKDPAWKGGAGG